ncbi:MULTISPECIES: alpha/beta fold hydrolase [unclassified Streptomyces]|uniref:alpha/beta fold hydrolase n=1 Tax=unclassified Streptomyces TaxID=2593676 RepID=UPI00166156BA|nr:MULTISPECIES: alpha/beta hydrolase [unclassified Streptomyces]MBD0709687.1 alpha/beta hydrolase [Streptomyces sp. CBMA291]MBD0713252.1 alpha/beta hydrolase [Streptomyces sp. CBMA370]
MDPRIRHHTVTVRGLDVFYREAGSPDAPVLLLLHGFPASSRSFRDLMGRLAGDYRVIAPDHIGFGHSALPSVEDFDYTFARLAEITEEFTRLLGLSRFALYVHDYGAPIGWRLAAAHPERVTAIVSQNGNAYLDGLLPEFWAPVHAYIADPDPETETALRQALSPEGVRWQYTHGVPDETLLDPDAWHLDAAALQRPGSAAAQLRLIRDYAANLAAYPDFQRYFRESRVPLLAVWGAHDEIFGPEGARAFRRDLPEAEVRLLPTGHFALETHCAEIADLVADFLKRHGTGQGPSGTADGAGYPPRRHLP